MKIEDFASKPPEFILEDFFSGRLRGWGIVLTRMGNLQNRFSIEAEGRWEASANTLSLKETYFFDDGHQDHLTWTIIKRSPSEYDGRETLIEGTAKGEQTGNAFHWTYHREVPASDGSKARFGFDDWFFLHDKNRMTANASLTKFGIQVATLNAFYEREQAV
ncbi:DUF3833 family protein [Rhizobium sp. LjRoot30]|uniref:DUF3833 family protein n=1 Tax=Rhizobium sp. LjRoot30 TaxID=3342320 RepID=UPI003ECCCED1